MRPNDISKREETEEGPRVGATTWTLLVFICIFCLLSQWMRWLPVYLSSVTLEECDSASCASVAFTPLCTPCVSNTTDYSACTTCHDCRQTFHSEIYNFEDGVCMTTTEYGVLTGIGFSFTFSIFGLIAGFFVDLLAKRDSTILGVSALFCALTTLLTSYCSNFKQVVLLRAFLGAFQAFGAPASVHLIMSHFERAVDRPVANASYTIGVYLGAGLSSLSSLISARLGWKATYAIAGYLGIATAIGYELIMDINLEHIFSSLLACWMQLYSGSTTNERNPLLSRAARESGSEGAGGGNSAVETTVSNDDEDLVREGGTRRRNSSLSTDHFYSSGTPIHGYNHGTASGIETLEQSLPDLSSQGLDNFVSSRLVRRGRANSTATPMSFFAAVGSVFSSSGVIPGAMPVLLFGSCLRFAASIAVFVYVPVLVSRRFPSQGAMFSVFNALVVLTCGSISAFAGGKIGQVAVRQWGLAGLARLVALSGLLCLGPFIGCILSEQFWPCMALLAVGYLFGEAWMGASMALLQGLAPVRAQGLAMSLYLFLNWNLSALSTDFLGYLDPGTVHLAKFMTTFVTVPIVLSSCFFLYLDRMIVSFDSSERIQGGGKGSPK